MRPFLRNLWRAFWSDELAFKRWIRAFGAALALTIISVLSAAGTDADAIVAELRTWTWLDYVLRFGVGFLFSSVHAPKPAPEK
jgi:hypothetical protein